MKRALTAALLAATLALSGCGSEDWDDDCSHQMDDQRDAAGQPESISSAHSGDYHVEIWWYYRAGFAREFLWESGTLGSCEITDYTF